jgi:thrombospondin type 3 repeat protein/hemolysin type calcium-binding protein
MKRLRASALGGFASVLLCAGLAGDAQAATYRVSECGEDAAVSASWPIKYDSGGGCMQFEPYPGSFYDGSSFASAAVSAPAGTYFGNASFHWHLSQAASYNAAIYGFAPGGGARWAAYANTNRSMDGWASVTAISQVAMHMSCPGGAIQGSSYGCYDYGAAGVTGSDGTNDLDRATFGSFVFDVVDTVAPAKPTLGGELVDGNRQSGTRTLTIAASDTGGGVSQVTVAVNRAQTHSFASSCAISAGVGTRLQPCPGSVAKTLSVDTTGPPWRDGENELEVCAADLATSGEQPARSCETRTVTVGPPSQPPDTDGDGCSDAEEGQVGADPANPDTDGDGLGDCTEIREHSCLSPTNRDSDNDGIPDGADREPCRTEATGQVAGGVPGGTGIPRLDECANRITGGKHRDRLIGTDANDRIVGRQASDLLVGLGGRNCLLGNTGGDRLSGGPAADFLAGGPGPDRIGARDGVRDLVKCGSGRDRAVADRIDLVTGCERLRLR